MKPAPDTAPALVPRGLRTRIGYLLNRPAVMIRRRAEKILEPLGIIPPHMGVISILRGEGPITQRALGEHLKIDPTSMVWLIDALEKKGYVRRVPHPEDRRAHLIKLTPAGESLFHKAGKELDQLEKEFLSPLTHAEQDQLKHLLTKLFKSVRTHGIPKDMFKPTHD
jgi:DNA-binding MarR family transcriptional regulator